MRKDIINHKKTKSTKRRAYESLLLLLLTISLFVSATFAWFTDTAFSKGNKIFAGNLYVDVVATLDQMIERYNIDHPNDLITSDVTPEQAKDTILGVYTNLEIHDRQYNNPNYIEGTSNPDDKYLHEYYFIITDKDLAVMNIYNMEPGQVRRADINYLNTGDLAFSAAGAIKIDVNEDGSYKSYTGLETLKQQSKGNTETYKNEYAVGNGGGSSQTYDVIFSYPIEINNDFGTIRFKICFENNVDDFANLEYNDIVNLQIIDIDVENNTLIPADKVKLDSVINEYRGKTSDYVFTIDKQDDEIFTALNDKLKYFYNTVENYGEPLSSIFTQGEHTISYPSSNTIDPSLVSKGLDINHNEYSYYSAIKEVMDPIEYEYRFNKLIEMQAEKNSNGNLITYTDKANTDGYVSLDDTTTTYYKDEGGHLEDILEVYIPSNLNQNISIDTKKQEAEAVINYGQTITPQESITIPTNRISERDIILDKDNGYFFGTVRQFNHLMQFGYSATENFNHDIYSFEDHDLYKTIDGVKTKVVIDDCLPEEEYMYLYEDTTKDLYTDYQNYLMLAGGYCLPRDVLKDSDGCYPFNNNNGQILHAPNTRNLGASDPRKVEVIVSGGGVEKDTFYFANELGSTSIAIYMPEDADSRYQNASISLSYGVTATQVEFEMDDTGCMVYDKHKKTNVNVDLGDVLMFKSIPVDESGATIELPFRVIKVDNNQVTFMFPRDFMNIILGVAGGSNSSTNKMLVMMASYVQLLEVESSGSDLPDLSKMFAQTPYIDSQNSFVNNGLDYQLSGIDIVHGFAEALILNKTDSIESMAKEMAKRHPDEEGELDIEDLKKSLDEEFSKAIFDCFTPSAISSEFNQFAYELSESSSVKNIMYSLDDITYFGGPYFSAYEADDTKTYTINKANSYLRLLTLKDIYDFYGTDTLTTKQIAKFIYGSENGNEDAAAVWLADASIETKKLSGKSEPEIPSFVGYDSLLINADGSITSENVAIYDENGNTTGINTHETRYVFTVDMSSISEDSYRVYSNGLEDVDLSNDSDVWKDINSFIKPDKPSGDGSIDILYLYDSTVLENNEMHSYISNSLENELNTNTNSYTHDPFSVSSFKIDALPEFSELSGGAWYADFDDVLDAIMNTDNKNIDYVIVNSKNIDYDKMNNLYVPKYNKTDETHSHPIPLIYVGTCDRPDDTSTNSDDHINALRTKDDNYHYTDAEVLMGFGINSLKDYISNIAKADDTTFSNYFSNFDKSFGNGNINSNLITVDNMISDYGKNCYSWYCDLYTQRYFEYNSSQGQSSGATDFHKDLIYNGIKTLWKYDEFRYITDLNESTNFITTTMLDHNNLLITRNFDELEAYLAKFLDYDKNYEHGSKISNSHLEIFICDLDGLSADDESRLESINSKYSDYVKFIHYVYAKYDNVKTNLVNYILRTAVEDLNVEYANPYWAESDIVNNFAEYHFNSN